jgi:hypothetical protein
MRFQVLFHSPPGVLFTFPSRYWFTIGRQEYLALDGGPPGFPHERPSTWYSGTRPGDGFAFAYGAVTLCGWPFHATSASEPFCNSLRAVQCTAGRPYNTKTATAATYHAVNGLGSSAFARHYSRNVCLFLEVLRCFSSLGFLDRPMNSVERTRALPRVGFPIRTSPGDNACSQLPEAFRRLPRPSSALGAKASTARP